MIARLGRIASGTAFPMPCANALSARRANLAVLERRGLRPQFQRKSRIRQSPEGTSFAVNSPDYGIRYNLLC